MDNNPGAGVVSVGFKIAAVLSIRWAGPVEKSLGSGDRKIDTTMTHGLTKVIMPVGAVQAVAFVEVLNKRYVGEIVVGVVFSAAAGHALVFDFGPDGELADGGGSPLARGDREVVDQAGALVSVKMLFGEVNLKPFFFTAFA